MKERLIVGLAVLAVLFSLPGTIFADSPSTFTCTGNVGSPEVIPAGTYQALIIPAGTYCTIPSGTVRVLNGVTIQGNGALQANISGTTVKITGGVTVGNGGVFALGCAPSDPCPSGPTNDTVSGGIQANGALGILLHGNTINGGLSIQGGGGGIPPSISPIFATMVGFPYPFSAIEGNTVNGGITVDGLNTTWLGFHRNRVNGGLTLLDSNIADPFQLPDHAGDIEMAENTIRGNLVCNNNSGVWLDTPDGGTPNSVSGRSTGQCANLQ